MNLKRDLMEAGVSLVVITMPIGGRSELSKVCEIADSTSQKFLAVRDIVGVDISGSWSWRRIPYETTLGHEKTGKYPAIVFIATVRDAAPLPSHRQATVDLLTLMIAEVIDRVEVDFKAAPVKMFFNGNQYEFARQAEKVDA